MPQWELDHFSDSLDLTMQPTNVLVRDNWYSLLLRCGFAHHLNYGRLRDLYWAMGPCSRSDQRDSTAEDAEKGHVTFYEGHVHESSFHKAHELLVNAQSNVSRSEDDGLRVLYLGLFDRDIFV